MISTGCEPVPASHKLANAQARSLIFAQVFIDPLVWAYSASTQYCHLTKISEIEGEPFPALGTTYV